MAVLPDEIRDIPMTQLVISPLNSRKDTGADANDTTIQELAADIAANGLHHPLTVRPRGENFEIIAGQRRFRALEMNGALAVKCKVVNATDQEAIIISLSENLNRANMTLVDKTRAFEEILGRCEGRDQDEKVTKLMKATGYTKNTVQKYIIFTKMSPEALKLSQETESKHRRLNMEITEKVAQMPLAEQVKTVEYLRKVDLRPAEIKKVMTQAPKSTNEIAELVVRRQADLLKLELTGPFVRHPLTKRAIDIPIERDQAMYDYLISLEPGLAESHEICNICRRVASLGMSIVTLRCCDAFVCEVCNKQITCGKVKCPLCGA